ncbi:glycosyltransferase 87 family protein [Paenibacillus sp. GP183]|uniref:glycosyltransferase 87 family protein n=1 Tax=Paenibacillus sp. GP183 TaxID=1882751 RepID=UPI00089C89BC|nr:glycosyltransferase 87 family protein [Paenibacillus sp. GP183]SEB51269.1 Mannosyltransferase related to Gpi18 [Paenibacillus sp. GP183]
MNPPNSNSDGNPKGKSNGNMVRGSANSETKYATSLSVYGLLFFGLLAGSYYLISRKNLKIRHVDKKIIVFTLLGTGLFLRVAAAPWIGGFPTDIRLFSSWATSAAQNLGGFYTHGFSDYPPFYIYVLFLVGKLASLPALSSYFTLLIKLPSILADIATAYFIYRLAVKYLSLEWSLMISAAYIFNPAVFINSTFWGQVDSFFAMIVVLAVLLLTEKKVSLSAALFTAAVLMKPQGIIFLPVLFFELVRLKSVKRFLTAAVTMLGTALVIILPFSYNQQPLWIIKLFSKTLGEYPYASVNAFNFFSLLRANYKQASSTLFIFSYHTWGMIFIVLVTALSFFIYIKGRNATYASAAALLQIAGVFTFSSSMHERYLFPAAALALISCILLRDKRLLWLSAGYSATIFINTYTIYYGSPNGGVPYNFPLFITSLLNVVFFFYLVKVVWDITVRNKTFNLSTLSKHSAVAQKQLSNV